MSTRILLAVGLIQFTAGLGLIVWIQRADIGGLLGGLLLMVFATLLLGLGASRRRKAAKFTGIKNGHVGGQNQIAQGAINTGKPNDDDGIA